MKPIFIDFETYYGDGYSLSLKEITTESYVRDPRFKIHGMGIAVGSGPAKWVPPHLIRPVLERVRIQDNAMVGHNLQFDGFILSQHFGIIPKMYIDTLGMSRAVIGPHSARHGLKHVAEILCGATKMDELIKAYNKRDLPAHVLQGLIDYTIGAVRRNEEKQLDEAGDVILTRMIFAKMMQVFPKAELKALDWTIRAFTCPRLYLDSEMLGEYIEEIRARKRQVLVEAGLENRDLLMSNPKYAEALESLGVTPPTKISPKTGKVSFAFAKTDEAHKALLEHPNPDVQALVAARIEHKSTIEETRAVLYKEAGERGAWPVAYNYAGAQVTQRLSGNRGGGGNPQNLKRGGTLRMAIYAAEGEQVGVADLSQIEARITLWLGMQLAGPDSAEAEALRVMAEGGDIYAWFGSKIYGYEISKHKTPHERQVAKSAVLGLGYGMGPVRFIDYCKQNGVLGVDEKFAEDIVRLYRGMFKGVRKFWSQCNKAVNLMLDGVYGVNLPFEGHTLVVTSPDPLFLQPAIQRKSGLYIKYPDLQKDAEGEITYKDGNKRAKLFGGKVCENIVQAVARDILMTQLVELAQYYPVAMQTHDEIVAVIPEEDADTKVWNELKQRLETTELGKFSLLAQEIMTRPIEYLPGLPLAIEADTAIRYGEAK